MLASDHGFGPTLDVFHVNSWLEREATCRGAGGERRGTGRRTKVGFAQVTRHVHAVDWDRTLAYAATPSSQGINIVSRVPGTDEPLPEEARLRIAAELTERLRTLRRPRDGAPLVAEVWARGKRSRSARAAGPGPVARAPDGTISILPSDTLVARRPQPRGHHRPEGVFVASGPGIRRSEEVAELSIVDVAPLVLHRLGCRCPTTSTAGFRSRSSSPRSWSDGRRSAPPPPPGRLHRGARRPGARPRRGGGGARAPARLGYVE